MDPLTAGLISGGIGLVGTYLSNQQSEKNAQKQMDFQQKNSDSAHVREVADLKKAGLNPILSALGSGASTPQGAQATVSDYAPGISKGMETAIAVKTQNKQLQSMDANIANTAIDSAKKGVETAVLRTEGLSSAEDVKRKGLENKLLSETMPHLVKKAKAEGDWSQVNQLMNVIKSGASSASDIMSIPNPTKLKGAKTLPLKGNIP